MSRTSAPKLLHVADVSKIEILGAQDEKIFVEFSMKELANLGLDRSTLIAALQAQNVVQPAGVIQTGYETLPLRVSGAFRSEQDVARHQLRCRRPHAPPQRYRASPARLLPIRRNRCSASMASRPSGLRSPCATAATSWRSARISRRRWREITADLPLGIEPKLVADQAVTVESAIAEFMTSLWQAIAIILVVSFISLGVRPGLVIALAIPLTLAIVFSIMDLPGIDMQRISLGALIIALALLVDDAMTTTDAMLTRLAQGDDKVQAATFAFRTYAFAMLAGTLSPLPASCRSALPPAPRANTRSRCLRWSASRSSCPGSWRSSSRRCWASRSWPPKRASRRARPGLSHLSKLSHRAPCARNGLTIALTLALFVASFLALPLIPRQFFPSSDRPELLVDLSLPQNASIYASERRGPALRCRCSRTIRMSRAGAPMWAAAPFASICRSMCSCRTISLPRR